MGIFQTQAQGSLLAVLVELLGLEIKPKTLAGKAFISTFKPSPQLFLNLNPEAVQSKEKSFSKVLIYNPIGLSQKFMF